MINLNEYLSRFDSAGEVSFCDYFYPIPRLTQVAELASARLFKTATRSQLDTFKAELRDLIQAAFTLGRESLQAEMLDASRHGLEDGE